MVANVRVSFLFDRLKIMSKYENSWNLGLMKIFVSWKTTMKPFNILGIGKAEVNFQIVNLRSGFNNHQNERELLELIIL